MRRSDNYKRKSDSLDADSSAAFEPREQLDYEEDINPAEGRRSILERIEDDYDDPVAVSEEEFAELDGQIKDDKPKRKNSKKALAIIVAASLATGATASYFGYQGILNNLNSTRAWHLIDDFKSGSVSILPGRIFTYQNHDFEYTTGNNLVDAAKKQNIGIVRIGDQFITPNGERVAKVLVEIEVTKAKPIRMYEVDGKSFYIEPYGYEWNNTNAQCETTETQVIERFVFANNDHDYYATPVPNSRVKEVLSVEEFDSISYEEAQKMDLIADVNDTEALSTSDKCNIATLKLVPNNKK